MRIRKSQKVTGLRISKRTPKFRAMRPTTDEREPTAQEKLLLRGIIASDIEALVYLWLEGENYREGVDFSFQSGIFGGRQEAGGQVADFILYTGRAYPLVIRVMGEYWHQTPAQQGKDDAAKAILESAGFEVVDVWEKNIFDSLNYTMEMALKGVGLRD